MLAANRDGSRYRQRQRALKADGSIENRVHPAQKRSAECRKAMGDQFVERVALIHTLYLYGSAVVRHKPRSYSNCRRRLSSDVRNSATSRSSASTRSSSRVREGGGSASLSPS